MAAIVRVKRRREDDVVDSLVLYCKKIKTPSGATSTVVQDDQVKSVFKFAGTVTDKTGTVATQCVSQAIRKSKLEKQYKLPERSTNWRTRAERHQADTSQSRYKIVSERRALDFASLADDAASKTNAVQTKTEPSTSSGVEVSDEANDDTKEDGPTTASSSRMFCMYDVEKVVSSKHTSAAEVTDEASPTITCNNVPLVRETVAPSNRMPSLAVPETLGNLDADDQYVFDVYYMNDAKFDFQALENVLAVEAYRQDDPFMYDCWSDDEEDDADYDDEDDENAENNWRNDYPDEDPTYFERMHLNDGYSSDDDHFR